MQSFVPRQLVREPDYCRFEDDRGLEFVVRGGPHREELAWEIIGSLPAVRQLGTSLLYSFMKDKGIFDLESVEVLPQTAEDGASFLLRYSFTADHDPEEYGYTYFDVYYAIRTHLPCPQCYWPIKFTVGFH